MGFSRQEYWGGLFNSRNTQFGSDRVFLEKNELVQMKVARKVKTLNKKSP